MSLPAAPFQSRYAYVTPTVARQAYAAALADVLKEILEREGPEAVRALSLMTDQPEPSAAS
jgi:hypothetical protein